MSLVFVANRTTATTRRETVAGTEYLVVPVVALVSGVVNSEYVPVTEIIPEDWNGVPVPLGHPQANGEYISARSPELEAQAPARFYRARLENNSLKGEIWINLVQAQAIGGEAAEAVKRFEAGQMVNVSTGYFRDLEPTSGTYSSKAYTGIARNLRPDQLAILLNEDGACNLADGCGAPRVNALRTNQMDFSDSVIIAFYPSATDAQTLALTDADLPKGSEVTPPSQLHVTLCHLGQIDEMTQGEDVALRELANFASRMPIVHATVGGVGQFNNDDPQGLFAIIDSTYLQDWRRSLVYWVEDYFSIRRDYGFTPHCTLAYVPAGQPVGLPMPERREIVFDSVALSWGNRTTVFRLQGELREVTDDYEMTGNAKRSSAWDFIGRIAKKIGINLKPSESEVTVNEKDKLIAALVANTRCKFKEEELKKFDEGQLKTLSDSMAEPTPAPEPAPPAPPAPEPTPVPVPAATGQADPILARLDKLETMITGLTGQITANADQEKAQIIAALVANQTTFTAEELGKMELPILHKMQLQFTPADYSLRGMPVVNVGGGEWVEYEVVTPSQNGGTN